MTQAELFKDLPESQRSDDAPATESFSLERMQLALDAGSTGLWDWDLVTGDVHLDERVRALFGLPLGMKGSFDVFRNALHPKDRRRTREAVEHALDPHNESDFEIEYRVVGQTDNVERWISVRGRTFFDAGLAIRVLGTARDITPRKLREQHVATLMRELVHRSKNLLAVVQSIARQTSLGAGSIDEFQQKFTARLQALSMAHDLLVSRDWRSASLHDLVCLQMAYCLGIAQGDLGDRAAIEGPRVMLKPEAAQNIGLALHELATNALAYGALSTTNGRVNLVWRVENERLTIEWRETGGPCCADAPAHEGFGHKVVKRLVALALDGEASASFQEEGFMWRLSIPTTHLDET